MDENAILVVEDDPNIRDIVEVALRFHGFRVTGVETGDDALTEVDRDPPALIVLDVMLPGIDGFEVCRRIRAAGKHIPVIFLTARDTPTDTVRGLTLGGDDYVTKPFSVSGRCSAGPPPPTSRGAACSGWRTWSSTSHGGRYGAPGFPWTSPPPSSACSPS
jgi:CheY-like chemotaxis protein